ncbi:hypothetical protein DERF_012229 [Dermatophagoides farinae]|uniref:Uncharacterized protein n=1 Tax=Dermatophagoides farinae TaxID=6954 RepID=A0A922L1I3_DERFA|nr:hypothetical protein DERF_012229 [Dermatophagoides farinae]
MISSSSIHNTSIITRNNRAGCITIIVGFEINFNSINMIAILILIEFCDAIAAAVFDVGNDEQSPNANIFSCSTC